MDRKYSPHLHCAHLYWKTHLKEGDHVIDATAGNGRDALFLAEQIFGQRVGVLQLFDIQEIAIENSRKLLQKNLPEEIFSHLHFHLRDHREIFSLNEQPVSLIVYNLGYLPGGDKSLTTENTSTLESIQRALCLLKKEGALSVMCYPGHLEGEKEEKSLLAFFKSLDPKLWQVCHHQWVNRISSPSLFWIKNRID